MGVTMYEGQYSWLRDLHAEYPPEAFKIATGWFRTQDMANMGFSLLTLTFIYADGGNIGVTPGPGTRPNGGMTISETLYCLENHLLYF